MYNAL